MFREFCPEAQHVATFYKVKNGPVVTLSDLLEFYGNTVSTRVSLAYTLNKSVWCCHGIKHINTTWDSKTVLYILELGPDGPCITPLVPHLPIRSEGEELGSHEAIARQSKTSTSWESYFSLH